MTTDLHDQLAEMVSQFRKEIEKLGLVSSSLWHVPGSARAPVLYLLIGESSTDLEQARVEKN